MVHTNFAHFKIQFSRLTITNDSYRQIRNPYSKNYFVFQPPRPTTTKESFIFSSVSVRTGTAQPTMKYMYFTNVNNMPNAVKPSFLTYKFNIHFPS